MKKEFRSAISKKSILETIPQIINSNMEINVKRKIIYWIIDRYIENNTNKLKRRKTK